MDPSFLIWQGFRWDIAQIEFLFDPDTEMTKVNFYATAEREVINIMIQNDSFDNLLHNPVGYLHHCGEWGKLHFRVVHYGSGSSNSFYFYTFSNTISCRFDAYIVAMPLAPCAFCRSLLDRYGRMDGLMINGVFL